MSAAPSTNGVFDAWFALAAKWLYERQRKHK